MSVRVLLVVVDPAKLVALFTFFLSFSLPFSLLSICLPLYHRTIVGYNSTNEQSAAVLTVTGLPTPFAPAVISLSLSLSLSAVVVELVQVYLSSHSSSSLFHIHRSEGLLKLLVPMDDPILSYIFILLRPDRGKRYYLNNKLGQASKICEIKLDVYYYNPFYLVLFN